jgi:short-subunit dehydrogenase involved in D-alanine esterification of teichoic acids
MKYAITGHTSGIGKALFDHFGSQGHNCIGFSKSVGYDINNASHREQIVNQCVDYDVFINNAYSHSSNSQLFMLQEMYASWKNLNKIIINISSRITEFSPDNSSIDQRYRTHKQEQDVFCLKKYSNPQVFNLKPGMVDTPRVMSYNHNKLAVEDIVKIVSFVIDNRDSYKITTLTVGL